MSASCIYWAAPFFDHAWLRYNEHCAALLRGAGYDVFLPQEQAFNDPGHDPDAETVFDGDLAEIRQSDALIAVLDGETIDSGVAAEAGLAYAYGIPVIGLYTDLRQHRRAEGRSYKNLFVLGLARRSHGVLTHEDELLPALAELFASNPACKHGGRSL